MSEAVQYLVDRGVLDQDVPLGPFTTYKSGGPARLFAEVGDMDALEELISSGVTADRPVLILGRGSNLVVADSGFEGLVLRLGKGFGRIEIGDDVQAGGMVPLPRLARASVDAGLTGLEFFVGVPGSVGGAVRQNAGCFGEETKDRLIHADVLDLRAGDLRRSSPVDLDLRYRHSNIGPHEVVLEATFSASHGDVEWSRARLREITRWRRDNQPGGTLNAGSVFKNPEDISAGELIDSLGLKGLSVGDVSVSEKHANFFVAGPEATSADIRQLVEVVKHRVLKATGTKLEPEIQFVGFEE